MPGLSLLILNNTGLTSFTTTVHYFPLYWRELSCNLNLFEHHAMNECTNKRQLEIARCSTQSSIHLHNLLFFKVGHFRHCSRAQWCVAGWYLNIKSESLKNVAEGWLCSPAKILFEGTSDVAQHFTFMLKCLKEQLAMILKNPRYLN